MESICANFHVVQGAQDIQVSFSDQTVLRGTIVGVDPRNDIAVVKVDASKELLSPVALGDSASLKVGQWAIAIGNPFGQFGRTLTTGVNQYSASRGWQRNEHDGHSPPHLYFPAKRFTASRNIAAAVGSGSRSQSL